MNFDVLATQVHAPLGKPYLLLRRIVAATSALMLRIDGVRPYERPYVASFWLSLTASVALASSNLSGHPTSDLKCVLYRTPQVPAAHYKSEILTRTTAAP